MKKKPWVISDTHFGHRNILKFTKPDGSYIRPGYTDDSGLFREFGGPNGIEFHDESLISRWNERIAPHETVYFLGDFGHPLDIVDRLNGKISCIIGNHDDIHPASKLGEKFKEVVFWKVFNVGDGGLTYPIVLTHAPLHADERKPAQRRIVVHGHIHEKVITRANGMPDPWYINVCVEHTNHAPMSWDSLVAIVKDRVNTLKALGEIE